jgi:GNAT superfamily N-acetyltransferase
LGARRIQVSVDGGCDIDAARTLWDFLYVRALRNRVRMQMTNDTGKVGFLRQLRFYRNKPANVQLYVARIGGARAGYLLLREAGVETFITEAVDERYRRNGVGRGMVEFAKSRARSITAEILVGNVASRRLHEAAGFTLQGDDGRVATYRFGVDRGESRR